MVESDDDAATPNDYKGRCEVGSQSTDSFGREDFGVLSRLDSVEPRNCCCNRLGSVATPLPKRGRALDQLEVARDGSSILLGQQHGRGRPIGLGDDPKAHAVRRGVGGEKTKTLHEREFVLLAVVG